MIADKPQKDSLNERRYALTKVYSLLLKLADESGKPSATPKVIVKEEKAIDTAYVQLELLK